LKPFSAYLGGRLVWKTPFFHLIGDLDEGVLGGAGGQGSLAVVHLLNQVEHALYFGGDPKVSFQFLGLHGLDNISKNKCFSISSLLFYENSVTGSREL